MMRHATTVLLVIQLLLISYAAGSRRHRKCPCAQPKKAGPCYARFRRYFYNTKSGACEQFFYGGCRGNANNFKTKEACERACTGRRAPVINCTFEEVNICGFTQDTSDQFNWTRSSGATPSFQTGPSTDHTNGTAAGYYMYIETSSPRNLGDKARLYSPIYKGPMKPSCVKFWYHMYGATVGTLNVYVVRNGNMGEPVWTLAGDQGDQWNATFFDVGTNTTDYQVVFEGIRGSSFTGDIAIDDFSLEEGKCNAPASKRCPCGQAKQPGPCKGSFPRYFYNTKTGTCQRFIYGGCGGNANNFKVKAQCERACVKCRPPCASCRCAQPKKKGPCKGRIPAYFYSTDTGKCKRFFYGGCRGNRNRFTTKRDCERACRLPSYGRRSAENS